MDRRMPGRCAAIDLHWSNLTIDGQTTGEELTVTRQIQNSSIAKKLRKVKKLHKL